jgi:hypothetical protein
MSNVPHGERLGSGCCSPRPFGLDSGLLSHQFRFIESIRVDALAEAGIPVTSVMLISKPYMQRRAYATIRKAWPEVEPVCASEDISFDEYLKSIGDDKLVIDMLVGDLQRVVEYPARGFAVAQDVPADVTDAYQQLIAAGYDSRLMKE